MDQDRFDALTKEMAGRRSRRGVLKALGGALLGAVAGGASLDKAGANPPPKKCKYQGYNCNGNADCCTLNCCNRTCCGDGQICSNGQCVFAATTTPAPTTTTTPTPTTTTTPAPTTTTTPAPTTTTTTTTPVPTSTTCTPGADVNGNPGQYGDCLSATGSTAGCKDGCVCINAAGPGALGYCDACTKCDGSTCAALQTDPNNCGGCGNICPSAQTCAGGMCACPYGGTYVYCPAEGACFPLDKDPNNCGKCGNVCAAGTTCQYGICA